MLGKTIGGGTMDMIKRILAPTDLSELSEIGVRYALNLAATLEAEVTVYHVVSQEEIMQYGQQMQEGVDRGQPPQPSSNILERYQIALSLFLNEHFSDLLPWVKVREKVDFGTPARNIADQAKTGGYDLIVMSTHGRTGLSHVLLGSVTEKVVRYAPCPVLSIAPRGREKGEERTLVAS